jgi:hypothetical protein
MHKTAWALTGGLTVRQKIWEAIRAEAGREWTARDIAAALDHGPRDRVKSSSITDYITALARAGILTPSRTEKARGFTRIHYTLARDEGHDAPRVNRGGQRVTHGEAQARIWRTLRMHPGKTLSVREIAAFSSSPVTIINARTARAYLAHLERAGYLLRDGERIGLRAWPHGSPPGPRAPMVCRPYCVFDPNTTSVVWAQTVITEDDAHE